MNHAKDISAGCERDFAGLRPEVQLRDQVTVAEIPDPDRTIVIGNREALAARIY